MTIQTKIAALLCIFVTLPCFARESHAESRFQDLELTLGAMGILNGNFLDKSDDLSAAPGNPLQLVYPGFAGVGGGGGLSAEVRWRNTLGIEVDLFVSSDTGFAYIDLVRVDIGQTAWHVPILFKGISPSNSVRPSIMAGVELVFPASLQVETTPLLSPTATRIGSKAGAYAMLVLGAGLEFPLDIDGYDIRIPFTLRGGFNPGVPNAARDRADYLFRPGSPPTVGTVIFSSEWQYQVQATLGVSWTL